MTEIATLRPQHFALKVQDRIAVVRLDRPDRKNPLTFQSYAELRDFFRSLPYATDVDVVVFASNGGNFCSGGDVHDIIGPLVAMDMKQLLAFTRMTGDLVKAAKSRSSRRWTGFARARARLWRWRQTCDWRAMRRNVHSCLPALGWRDATWGPARCCPALSGKGARPNCCIPGG
jgi:hypothetical protein